MSKYAIIYDNHCAVCSIGVKNFQKIGNLQTENTLALDNWNENELACNVNPQRACDEMAVIDKETKHVEYGPKGYALLISERYPFLSSFVSSNWFLALFKPLYVLFASNRRIIAPLSITENTCTPSLRKTYRLAFIVLISIYAFGITYWKGEAMAGHGPLGFLNGWKLISVTGPGWLITAILFRKANKWDYWGQLAFIAGSAIFLQSVGLLIYKFTGLWEPIFISMLLSEPLMVWMHYRRVKVLKISQGQTLKWWIILHVVAGTMVYLWI